jgi:phosphohistidine phosphatase
MNRRLLLLRHAKSSWDDPGLPDHDRPLAPRGRRAVDAMHDHFAERRIAPDLVLCSTARRTVETWEAIAPAVPSAVTVEFDDDLYGAAASTLLRRVRRVSDDVDCVLVVAHNPGMEDLAQGLVGAGDTELRQRLDWKFPTGALATLTIPPSWADLYWGAAELADYVVPRDL